MLIPMTDHERELFKRGRESCREEQAEIISATETTGLDFTQSADASLWAKAFVETKQKMGWTLDQIDEGLMLAWFANAMMRMHDHCETREEQAERLRQVRGLLARCRNRRATRRRTSTSYRRCMAIPVHLAVLPPPVR